MELTTIHLPFKTLKRSSMVDLITVMMASSPTFHIVKHPELILSYTLLIVNRFSTAIIWNVSKRGSPPVSGTCILLTLKITSFFVYITFYITRADWFSLLGNEILHQSNKDFPNNEIRIATGLSHIHPQEYVLRT